MRPWNPRGINLQKLAGIKSILGLDITGRHVRVVEMKLLRGTLNKFNSRFAVTKYFTCDIADNASLESSSAAIREELDRHGITSHYVVSALQTGNVKSVRAEVPADAANIDEWLQDNFGKLLKIPVVLNELAYQYEVLQTGPSSNIVEFFFARSAEVESMIRLVGSLRLDLLALSVGVRDSVNPLFFTDRFIRDEPLSYVFAGEEGAAIFDFEEGKIVGSCSAASVADLPNRAGRNTLFAGTAGGDGRDVFMPFGIPTEYTLAAGLAIKGFIPDLHPIDFMPPREAGIVMERLSRGLFQRVVLACGGILLVLLLLQSIFSIYLDGLRREVETGLLESSAGYSELAILEKRNSSLRNELALLESDSARTNIAKTIHDIAKITPEGVWLYKITMTKDQKGEAVFLISGYSGDSKRIAEFVRLFEKEPRLHNVRILRSGLPAYGENMTAIGKKISSPLTFTLSLTAGL